jgi:hypothetical protein
VWGESEAITIGKVTLWVPHTGTPQPAVELNPYKPECWLVPIIPATWEVEVRGLWFEASLREKKKVTKTLSQRTRQVCWCMLVIPVTQEV